MSEAFHRHKVDTGTSTASIAELQAAEPKTYNTLVFDLDMEILLDFAKKDVPVLLILKLKDPLKISTLEGIYHHFDQVLK